MTAQFLFLFLGLGMLTKGSDLLLTAALSYSSRLKINPLFLGLTLVAVGTSIPELTLSLASTMSGDTQLVLGNIFGANITNILLNLGISALIAPLIIKHATVRFEIPFSILAVATLVLLSLHGALFGTIVSIPFDRNFANVNIGTLQRIDGLLLLGFFAIFIYSSYFFSKSRQEKGAHVKRSSTAITLFQAIIGIVGIFAGSLLTLNSVQLISETLNLSSHFIGLSFVSLGTSLPELVTNIRASVKKRSDLAIGNVIGSNIINICFVLGIASLVRPIPLKGVNTLDFVFLAGSTIYFLILIFVFKRYRVGRYEGLLLLGGYIAYLITITLRSSL